MRIFINKKGKRGQIFPMRAGDAKQKINLPWPNLIKVDSCQNQGEA